jgi:hypothetical protein
MYEAHSHVIRIVFVANGLPAMAYGGKEAISPIRVGRKTHVFS